jgi:hypothetical protein
MTSTGSPLSVAEISRGATRSIHVDAPGALHENVMVVVDAKDSGGHGHDDADWQSHHDAGQDDSRSPRRIPKRQGE